MKIFVSAAEISSDIHAEKILKAIQEKLLNIGQSVEWQGIGGPRVRALQGFQCFENAENLRTMGFFEVLKKIKFFRKLIHKTVAHIESFNPDIILTFDYPDFHFRVIEAVVNKKIAPQALRICAIPPKVWVWRSHRVEKIRKFYHGVWVIFPFENDFYKSKKIPVIYEGNPLIDSLIECGSPQGSEKKSLETITVMPGSRDAELKYHLPVIPKALELFSKLIQKKVIAQVPIPAGVNANHVKESLRSNESVEYRFIVDGSAQSLRETKIGLIKSGTSTLEAAVLNCIPVIYYKSSFMSELIFRLLILNSYVYPGPVGLPNILLGFKLRKDSCFTELLGSEANPKKLAQVLFRIYSSQSIQADSMIQCEKIRHQFFIGNQTQTSAQRSAERILEWKKRNP